MVWYSQEFIDLLLGTIFLEHSSQNSHSADPQDLGGHSGFLSTLSFTETHVSSLSLGLSSGSNAGTRVNLVRLADDQTVLD
jgi:hypothetical protein